MDNKTNGMSVCYDAKDAFVDNIIVSLCLNLAANLVGVTYTKDKWREGEHVSLTTTMEDGVGIGLSWSDPGCGVI